MNPRQLENAIEAHPHTAPEIVGGAPLRASYAGQCARKIAYYLRHQPQTDRPNVQSRIAFVVGTSVHQLIQSALLELHPQGVIEAEGVLAVLSENKEVVALWPGYAAIPEMADVARIGCHADFAFGRVAVEIKTMQPYAWDRSASEGPQDHHVLQAGLVGLSLGANTLQLVYIDKAKGKIMLHTLGEDAWQDRARAEALRLADIWHEHNEGRLPDPIDNRRRHWECKYCPFLTTCIASKRAEPSDQEAF